MFGGDRSAIYCVTGNLVGCEAGWLAVPDSWMWPSVVLSQSSLATRDVPRRSLKAKVLDAGCWAGLEIKEARPDRGPES